jgi:chromosome transmission fidelity protein 4
MMSSTCIRFSLVLTSNYSELAVKVVHTGDNTKIMHLREQPKAVKHLAFDPSGSYLAVSCSDGIVYFYSLTTEQPELVQKVDGLIRSLDTDKEASSMVAWHPDGRAFAAPTATRGTLVFEIHETSQANVV